MINPNDFIFYSEFGYMPIKDTGVSSTGSAGPPRTVVLLKTGVTGTPLVAIDGIDSTGEVYTGFYGFASRVVPVLRGGNLYGRYASMFPTVKWRVYGD